MTIHARTAALAACLPLTERLCKAVYLPANMTINLPRYRKVNSTAEYVPEHLLPPQ